MNAILNTAVKHQSLNAKQLNENFTCHVHVLFNKITVIIILT